MTTAVTLITWRRGAAVISGVLLHAFTFTAICLVDIVRDAMATAIRPWATRWRHITTVATPAFSAHAYTSIGLVVVEGDAMCTTVRLCNAWRRCKAMDAHFAHAHFA